MEDIQSFGNLWLSRLVSSVCQSMTTRLFRIRKSKTSSSCAPSCVEDERINPQTWFFQLEGPYAETLLCGALQRSIQSGYWPLTPYVFSVRWLRCGEDLQPVVEHSDLQQLSGPVSVTLHILSDTECKELLLCTASSTLSISLSFKGSRCATVLLRKWFSLTTEHSMVVKQLMLTCVALCPT